MRPSVRLNAVSTHSRLKAAGTEPLNPDSLAQLVSTHSRLKAAGTARKMFTNSRLFQHTAA